MGFGNTSRDAAHAGRLLVALALVALPANGGFAQENFATLLGELADRDRLAIHPNSAYSLQQASSYERRNTPLGAPFNYANADTANFIRTINVGGQTEYVMMEDTGPGAITRWWMTGGWNTDGQIRVYIDGQPIPVLAGQMQPLLSGSAAKYGESLAFQSRPGVDSGHNLYAPIPYADSVMVTYRGQVHDRPGWNPPVYYNINYRKYGPATNIASYSTSDPVVHSHSIDATNAVLANASVTGNVTDSHRVNGQVLTAGAALTHQLSGTGAIRRLKVHVAADDQAAALRNTYVELTFDGQRTARVPVSHFFGNGESTSPNPIHPFDDYYRRVEGTGEMTAYWVMPFESAAEVRLVNRGAQNVSVDLEIDSGGWTWDGNSMHFHADFRPEDHIATRGGNGTTDWTYLNARGRGTYVGDTLALRNQAGAWWGEGDEKVYVDYLNPVGVGHDAQPVHVGTGTEDYYGYAWAHNETFSHPFIAQPTGAGNNSPGHSVNSRVRGLDAIPFDNALKFDMELWHWASTSVDFGATTYWYGRPGAESLQVAADLAGDFRAGLDLAQGGIPDRAGDGQWFYLSSSSANPSAPMAATSLLEFGEVGNIGSTGYGGGQNGHNLAAISPHFIFDDGSANDGIQGEPGYHELAIHPAGNADGSFGGNAAEPFAVARWIAGASSAGLANITGSIRNFVSAGDGVDFLIYVDGQLRFYAFGTSATLPERHFDFDVTLAEGSTVDFVLGNNDAGNLFGDESLLSAMIWTSYDEFLPVEGDLDGDGEIGISDWNSLRTHFGASVSRLSRAAGYGVGDMNSDLRVDEYDFALFKAAYEAAHGSGSFARLLAVPEPSTLGLVVIALLTTVGSARRPTRSLPPQT